jgi:hypothetical protein
MTLENYQILNRVTVLKHSCEGSSIRGDNNFWMEVDKCYKAISEHYQSGGIHPRKWGVILNYYDTVKEITTFEYLTSEMFNERYENGIDLDRRFVYFIREHHLVNIATNRKGIARNYLAVKLYPWWKASLY